MRKVTKSDRTTIYLNTAPFFLGEAFCLGGFIIPFFALIDLRALGGFLFLAIGIYLVKRKVDTAKLGSYILKNGEKSVAEITNINNTEITHNSRTVKEYTFRFVANDKMFSYEYQSAFKGHLQIGQQMTIFYIASNPKLCFIPNLYNLNFY